MAVGTRANRAFLGRAVRYLTAQAGIRQFLDIGTGIPTAGNTHEIAQEIAPQTRVVYVDFDPVVLAHARALLTSGEAGASYLAISHGASDLLDQEIWRGVDDSWKDMVQQQFTWRSREQVARFFAGLDLVEPGLVPVEKWRPEAGTSEGKSAGWGAVARKP